jgi:hypothetical protein
MSYLETSCNVGLEERLAENFSVFPIPSNGKVYAQVNNTTINAYRVLDLSGRVIMDVKNLELPVLTIETSFLKSGNYLLHVETPFGSTQKSFVIE